jgi:hypothetical protein
VPHWLRIVWLCFNKRESTNFDLIRTESNKIRIKFEFKLTTSLYKWSLNRPKVHYSYAQIVQYQRKWIYQFQVLKKVISILKIYSCIIVFRRKSKSLTNRNIVVNRFLILRALKLLSINFFVRRIKNKRIKNNFW